MQTFFDALKNWRKVRRLSQLDLALEAEISTRHLSFLETGRSRPSAEMVGRLSDALSLPLSARNQLLALAGFAARYPARDWDDAAMAPILRAVDHMLDRHAPYPALAIDPLWRVERMNDPARLLFGWLGVSNGSRLLDLMCSVGFPQMVQNWPDVAHHAVQRLRTESAAQGGVAELDAAIAALSECAGTKAPPDSPVMTLHLAIGDERLSLFTTLAQFGTPEDLTLDDLKIELYFPADAATDAALTALAGDRSGTP